MLTVCRRLRRSYSYLDGTLLFQPATKPVFHVTAADSFSLMGFVAEAFTIRTSFTLLLLPVVLAVALVPILRPAAKLTAV